MIAVSAAGPAHAQPSGWFHVPAITVVGRDANDERFGLVDEAIQFWNRTLEELDSGFRLGKVTRLVARVPDEALQSLSEGVIAKAPVPVPQLIVELPGDIVVLLSEADFVSFARPFAGGSRRMVGIKGMDHAPFIYPAGALQADAIQIRRRAFLPADRRREARARLDVPYRMETTNLSSTMETS
jgi:hypothetical protein